MASSKIIKIFPQTEKIEKLSQKLYRGSLIYRDDFDSEVEWNVQYAKRCGVKVGTNCRFLGGISYSTEPYLI